MRPVDRALCAELVATPDGYRIDFAALEALISTERARCLLLCNPHNPTGRAFSADELTELLELAVRYDLLVIADEIHADLVLAGARHVPFASLGDAARSRTVTLSSASKAFNIAGLRCAVAAFGNRELAARFRAFDEHVRGPVNVLGMIAARAAWLEGGAWLDAVLSELEQRRSYLLTRLAGRDDVKLVAPEATYLAWLDLRGSGLGDDPAAAIAARSGLVLSSGPAFGPPGKGHVRLNFATSGLMLEEMLERLDRALERD